MVDDPAQEGALFRAINNTMDTCRAHDYDSRQVTCYDGVARLKYRCKAVVDEEEITQ